jgi:hypothetical protein
MGSHQFAGEEAEASSFETPAFGGLLRMRVEG